MASMKITIIGTGFVGVVSSAVYASFGHEVIGLDIDQEKVKSLQASQVPFFEPDLEQLLSAQQEAGNLSFTADYKTAISNAEIVILAVGTPSAADGQADLKYIFAATESLAPYLQNDAILAVKSTVPPGTLKKIEAVLKQLTKVSFHLASLPEFLREGSAVADTLHPDRVVIGAEDEFTFEKLSTLHQPLNAQIIKVKPSSAQMGKYSANAYLATRITFINQIADLCAKNGADVNEVIEIIGKDKRIGDHYWYPGLGYGGSCFPKDVNELAAYSRSIGETDNLLNRMAKINDQRIPKLLEQFQDKIGSWQDKKVAVLGLSFKPNTNDMREAPSTKVIPFLLAAGANVTAYDPESIEVAPHFIEPHQNLDYEADITVAIKQADVIMVLIEWPQILELDFAKHRADKQQWIIDARNQFSQNELEAAGYEYLGIGK
jgi:UDPglucose 6-dehydrogenase